MESQWNARRILLVLVLLGSLVFRVVSCAQRDAARDAATKAAVDQFSKMFEKPTWEGCPIELGVAADQRPPGGLEVVRAAAAEISERTGFVYNVSDAPEDARLWIVWSDPREAATQLPTPTDNAPTDSTASTTDSTADASPVFDAPVISMLTTRNGLVINGGLAVDPSLAPDVMLWELRRELGEVATGDVDFTSPIQYRPSTQTTTTVAPLTEPPYDEVGVRAAAQSCTSLEDLGLTATSTTVG